MAENKKSKLNLRSRVKKNQNFPIVLLERQSIPAIKNRLQLVLNPCQEKILKCLKIAFVYSSDYPSFKVKLGDIFRHVPWLQIPSDLASVNILWWSKTCIKISLGSSSSGFWGAAEKAIFDWKREQKNK